MRTGPLPPLGLVLLLLGTTLAGCLGTLPDTTGSPAEPWIRTDDVRTEHGMDLWSLGAASIRTGADVAGSQDDAEGYGIISGDDLPPGGIGVEYALQLSPMRWSKTTLTVLIFPPVHHPVGDGPAGVFESRFLRAVEDSIVHWKEAIDQYGSDDLSGNVAFDVYVAGRDLLSPTQVASVDIVIGNPPGGVYLLGVAAYPLNPRCVIANFGLPSSSYQLMFMVSAHEFGHCLGMSHPGEGVGNAVGHDPWFDLMSYSWMNKPGSVPDVRLDCVSNLNLMAVHQAFAPAFGRVAQGPVRIAAADYFLTDCAERFLGTA